MGTARHANQSRRFTPHDHYQEVTNRVVAALEEGVVPWRRPWTPSSAGISALPRNATTRHIYRGINVVLLAMSPLAFLSGDNRWCSYKQASERGWQVRKGEHGTTIFFFRKLEVKGDEAATTTEDEKRFIPMLRAHSVFQASQIDGAPEEQPPSGTTADWRRPDAVDLILRRSGARVRTGGSHAFYSPLSDHIQLPDDAAFRSPYEWAATALHELGHWTGHAERLNRDLSSRFGTAGYAEEELRAELASCFMGSELGLPSDIPNHASYLESWLSKLRQDKREIFRAAAAAQKIADYCLAFHPEYGRQDDPLDAEAPGDNAPMALAA